MRSCKVLLLFGKSEYWESCNLAKSGCKVKKRKFFRGKANMLCSATSYKIMMFQKVLQRHNDSYKAILFGGGDVRNVILL